jgi:hypothetical protein
VASDLVERVNLISLMDFNYLFATHFQALIVELQTIRIFTLLLVITIFVCLPLQHVVLFLQLLDFLYPQINLSPLLSRQLREVYFWVLALANQVAAL